MDEVEILISASAGVVQLQVQSVDEQTLGLVNTDNTFKILAPREMFPLELEQFDNVVVTISIVNHKAASLTPSIIQPSKKFLS